MSRLDVKDRARISPGAILGSSCAHLVVFVTLFLSSVSSEHHPEDCCPPGTTWVKSTNCSDGSSIRLDCPIGIFKLDPETFPSDEFVIANASLVFSDGSRPIPAHRFCLARSEGKAEVAALVCFSEAAPEMSTWRQTVFTVLSVFSAFFLIVTLVVYFLLPELRDVQDKSMMSAIASLTVGYLTLAMQQGFLTDELCVPLAFVMYFGFLASFFWMNLVAFNVWRSVSCKNFLAKESTRFATFCAIGWGAPTCFLVAALITHHMDDHRLKPGFGESSCWFGGNEATWMYFYGPIAVLLGMNIVYLGSTCWKLWHQYKDCSGSGIRILRIKCLLYLKLVFVMGITWVFEVLSFATGRVNEIYWISMDILNGSQGFIIFLLLVPFRKRVRKLLARKKPCGIGFPKSWAACEDVECETVLPEEAVELSRSA